MKINKVKLLVGTMAIAAVAATVGSISGTVAWFQYSTRSTAAYQGASAHCTESLQIRIRSTAVDSAFDDGWHSDLTAAMIANYLKAADSKGGANRTAAQNELRPVTSGELDADEVAEDLYGNPIYQFPEMSKWKTASATEDFIEIPLELRVLDVTGTGSDILGGKPIYVSDVTLLARDDHAGSPAYVKADHLDLSTALRVGVSAGTDPDALTAYGTFSSNGAAVDTYGNLDLNADGQLDRDGKYEWAPGDLISYGGDSGQALSLNAGTPVNSAVKGIADDSTPSNIKGVAIGNTNAEGTKTLAVNLKIYLEGWTKIDNTGGKFKGNTTDHTAETGAATGDVYYDTTAGKYFVKGASDWSETVNPVGAVWDAAKGVGAEFNVGIRFSTTLHDDTHA